MDLENLKQGRLLVKVSTFGPTVFYTTEGYQKWLELGYHVLLTLDILSIIIVHGFRHQDHAAFEALSRCFSISFVQELEIRFSVAFDSNSLQVAMSTWL